MDPLLEGVVAAAQPCSLALVLPAAGATVLGGRNGWLVAIACWTTATLAAWISAVGVARTQDGIVLGVALAATALAGTGLLWLQSASAQPSHTPDMGRALLGGGLVGLAAGLLWRPCVGPALGVILTTAPDDPAGQLGPFAVYLAGLLAGTVALAALPHLHPVLDRAATSTPTRVMAAAPLLLLVLVLVTDRYGQVVGTLVRASSLT